MTQKQLALFSSLGLTRNEALVYVALLDKGTSSVSSVAKNAKINRRNAHDVVHTLINKGLVFQIVGEHEHTYSAVHPNKLVELVEAKEVALSSQLPDMLRHFNKPASEEYALIYAGIEGFRQLMRDIIVASPKEVYSVGSYSDWEYPELGSLCQWFKSERIKKGITMHHLFNASIATQGFDDVADECTKIKILPPTGTNAGMVIIYGDKVINIAGVYDGKLGDGVTLFIVVSEHVADGWRAWFRFMWDECASPLGDT